MATIDAARCSGLEREISSLEAGKKADIILVNMAQPHLTPLNMPAYRIAYFAQGSVVHTVIVDGHIVMENRRALTVDEDTVLDLAQQSADRVIHRVGLEPLLAVPERFWGYSRY